MIGGSVDNSNIWDVFWMNEVQMLLSVVSMWPVEGKL